MVVNVSVVIMAIIYQIINVYNVIQFVKHAIPTLVNALVVIMDII